MTEVIRVLVVDDSAFMRGSLKRRIENDSRFEVVDTAANGAEAVEKALSLRPDVVTLDVEMPVLNGIDALKRIVAQSSIPVVMVSSQTEAGAQTTIAALELGAVDFVPKSRGAEHIHEKLFAAVTANKGRIRRSWAQRAQREPLRSIPLRRPSRLRHQARIVIVGSSTGGPMALHEVLGSIPKNLPVPVVIAQHMPQQFTRALAKRLDELCAPNVVEAHDGQTLESGTVYIGPGGMQMRVTATCLRISEDKGTSSYKPSIDVLAESARAAFGSNVIGVMLTGMGQDGTREFVKLHQEGAHTIAQDQASCVVYGMPRALYEAGGAQEVLPLDRIGLRIRDLLGA